MGCTQWCMQQLLVLPSSSPLTALLEALNPQLPKPRHSTFRHCCSMSLSFTMWILKENQACSRGWAKVMALLTAKLLELSSNFRWEASVKGGVELGLWALGNGMRLEPQLVPQSTHVGCTWRSTIAKGQSATPAVLGYLQTFFFLFYFYFIFINFHLKGKFVVFLMTLPKKKRGRNLYGGTSLLRRHITWSYLFILKHLGFTCHKVKLHGSIQQFFLKFTISTFKSNLSSIFIINLEWKRIASYMHLKDYILFHLGNPWSILVNSQNRMLMLIFNHHCYVREL